MFEELRKEQTVKLGRTLQKLGRKFNPSGYTLDNYQLDTNATASYPTDYWDDLTDVDPMLLGLMYATLGLNGEAGELADKVKKIVRDDNGYISDEKRESMAKELGDVLWYAAQTSVCLGYSLSEVAEANRIKLFSRRERDMIKGSGDDR